MVELIHGRGGCVMSKVAVLTSCRCIVTLTRITSGTGHRRKEGLAWIKRRAAAGTIEPRTVVTLAGKVEAYPPLRSLAFR